MTSQALVDSGANGFIFIDTLYAYDLAKYLGLKIQRLPQPCRVTGYNGEARSDITYFLWTHVTINNRRQ